MKPSPVTYRFTALRLCSALVRPSRPWLAAALAVGLLPGCERKPPPGATEAAPGRAAAGVQPGDPTLPSELTGARPDAGALGRDAGAPPPWPGPFLVVTRSSAGIYADTTFDKERKMGYARSGGKVPIEAKPIEKDNCSGNWYRVVGGGYICGSYGTIDLDSPAARFATKQPDISEVLPYKYARNAKNGTPLYKSVPTPEQMHEYEPYLPGAKKKRKDQSKPRKKRRSAKRSTVVASHRPLPFSAEAIRRAAGRADAGRAGSLDAGAVALDAGPKEPWWQRDDIDDRLHEISIEALSADADDILAKRMVKGFYIAIDKHFNWNGRPWYKTTKGLVAPADRFWATAASDFKGKAIDNEKISLPVGWTYGWQKKRPKYRINVDKKTLKTDGSLERFVFVNLTGRSIEIGGKDYLESTDGFWMRRRHLRVTDPGPPPADLGPKERWVDVNLTRQTLVAFEGARPVYATLISSGKEHREKEKDHRTPSGEWRIREKHVTTTMDGDGTAAGDLPYSIEDVPYVMYFYRAYALHGAFWHRNYGIQMSHGCVNLAPLDAKYIFFFTEPKVPEGLHGVWSSPTRKGSRIVVHD